MAEDLDSVDGLCQVFAGVPGAACDLHVERLVSSDLGDNNSGLESVIEDNTVSGVPGSGVESCCATKSHLFLHGKDDHQRRMGQLLLHQASQDLQDDSNASRIVGAEIRRSVAVEHTIA